MLALERLPASVLRFAVRLMGSQRLRGYIIAIAE